MTGVLYKIRPTSTLSLARAQIRFFMALSWSVHLIVQALSGISLHVVAGQTRRKQNFTYTGVSVAGNSTEFISAYALDSCIATIYA